MVRRHRVPAEERAVGAGRSAYSMRRWSGVAFTPSLGKHGRVRYCACSPQCDPMPPCVPAGRGVRARIHSTFECGLHDGPTFGRHRVWGRRRSKGGYIKDGARACGAWVVGPPGHRRAVGVDSPGTGTGGAAVKGTASKTRAARRENHGPACVGMNVRHWCAQLVRDTDAGNRSAREA